MRMGVHHDVFSFRGDRNIDRSPEVFMRTLGLPIVQLVIRVINQRLHDGLNDASGSMGDAHGHLF